MDSVTKMDSLLSKPPISIEKLSEFDFDAVDTTISYSNTLDGIPGSSTDSPIPESSPPSSPRYENSPKTSSEPWILDGYAIGALGKHGRTSWVWQHGFDFIQKRNHIRVWFCKHCKYISMYLVTKANICRSKMKGED